MKKANYEATMGSAANATDPSIFGLVNYPMIFAPGWVSWVFWTLDMVASICLSPVFLLKLVIVPEGKTFSV